MRGILLRKKNDFRWQRNGDDDTQFDQCEKNRWKRLWMNKKKENSDHKWSEQQDSTKKGNIIAPFSKIKIRQWPLLCHLDRKRPIWLNMSWSKGKECKCLLIFIAMEMVKNCWLPNDNDWLLARAHRHLCSSHMMKYRSINSIESSSEEQKTPFSGW